MKVRGGIIESWQGMTPFGVYGVKPAGAVRNESPDGLGGASLAPQASPSVSEVGTAKPWSPDSPLFWFGVVLAVTFGLIGASTSIRVGPFKAAVAAGNS